MRLLQPTRTMGTHTHSCKSGMGGVGVGVGVVVEMRDARWYSICRENLAILLICPALVQTLLPILASSGQESDLPALAVSGATSCMPVSCDQTRPAQTLLLSLLMADFVNASPVFLSSWLFLITGFAPATASMDCRRSSHHYVVRHVEIANMAVSLITTQSYNFTPLPPVSSPDG